MADKTLATPLEVDMGIISHQFKLEWREEVSHTTRDLDNPRGVFDLFLIIVDSSS